MPQVREIGSGSSYLSQDAREAIFGLGDATEVERLDVRWPDGSWHSHGPATANSIIEIGQGEGAVMEDEATGAADVDDVSSAPPLSREDTLAFWELYRAAVATMRIDGDWAKAAEGFRAALALNPRHEESLYNLGNCLLEMGDYPGALEQFARLTTLDPQSQRGFLQIGKVRSSPAAGQAFDLALAEEAFREAVALNQEESGALIQLAMVELARGELESAAAHFEGLRVFDARSVHAAYFDGYIRWRQGDAEGARERLAEAIDFATGAAPTAPASSEGDTELPGDKALLAEGSARRTLFGPPLAELEAWSDGPPDLEQTEATYEALQSYVVALAP
jgi:tetratricopeptide (TPR) repeat protein